MEHAPYTEFAALFEYPRSDVRVQAQGLLADLDPAYPEAAAELERFLAGLPRELPAQEELYARSFEVQALASLHLGYVLFGDAYQRGALLVGLGREQRAAGLAEGGELPDHLGQVLRLLGRLGDEELRREMAEDLLRPALRLVLREFEPGRVAKKLENYHRREHALLAPGLDMPLVYGHALTALAAALARDFSLAAGEAGAELDAVPDFLARVSQELALDERGRESAP
ncbi:MAG: hypothetical protein HYV16_02925 [Gammaproteobacteria bacterium]|nr:hypothetical protein [Gammaproteobacteria bacterium]